MRLPIIYKAVVSRLLFPNHKDHKKSRSFTAKAFGVVKQACRMLCNLWWNTIKTAGVSMLKMRTMIRAVIKHFEGAFSRPKRLLNLIDTGVVCSVTPPSTAALILIDLEDLP